MDRTHDYGIAFILTLIHTCLLVAGFLILMDQFAFPEILRATSQERLALFQKNRETIIPAYYMMGLTGLTQVCLAVMFHQSFAKPGSTLLMAALVAGVLAGAFQTMGFMRWPIAIPYLADAMANASTDEVRGVVTLLEGLLNRYAGMVIGEHLGFLAQGSWTVLTGIAMLRYPLFAWPYGVVGVLLGVGILASSLEQLGGAFEFIGFLSAPVSAAWLGWLVMCGVSLSRTQADGFGPKFFIFSAIAMLAIMCALVVPAVM